ncbi:MAG: LPP20 family lipoprotein [Planctomycetota bacterium]|nr:LPP20 family lipoprotein [Planctomycetota bacterium]
MAKPLFLKLSCTALLLIGLVACQGAGKKNAAPLPQWAKDPSSVKQAYAAVGIGNSYEEADAEALAELANIIKVRLKSLETNYSVSTDQGGKSLSKSSIEAVSSAGISGYKVLGRHKSGRNHYILIGVRSPSQIISTLGDEAVKNDADKAAIEAANKKELDAISNARKACGIPQ